MFITTNSKKLDIFIKNKPLFGFLLRDGINEVVEMNFDKYKDILPDRVEFLLNQ